jgi:hypothetical protein
LAAGGAVPWPALGDCAACTATGFNACAYADECCVITIIAATTVAICGAVNRISTLAALLSGVFRVKEDRPRAAVQKRCCELLSQK